jgi:hypothetical protein
MNMPMPENEAERIYYAIFNREIPATVQDHFEALSKKIESRYSKEEVDKYFESIQKTCDLEALEIASRYFKKLPILSEKFLIMVYLAETRPENYMVFVNEQPGVIRACISLISSLLRTGYKVAKGIIVLAVNKI